MKSRRFVTCFPYLSVVAFAALVGLSLTRVVPEAAEHQMAFSLGGAGFALVAVGIARLATGRAGRPLPEIPERKLLGVKVGTVGFCVAICGWLLAVFVAHSAGFLVAVAGIAVGFVGGAIHVVLTFSPNE